MSSPILFRSLVLVSLILLKVRSTVHVVTGSTEIIPASLDKLGKAVAMSPWPISCDKTSCIDALILCKYEPPE